MQRHRDLHAPGIIAHLAPADLITKDSELKSFCEKVQEVKPARLW